MRGKSTLPVKAEISQSTSSATSTDVSSPRSDTDTTTSTARSIGRKKRSTKEDQKLPRKNLDPFNLIFDLWSLISRCLIVRRSRPNKDTVKTEVRLVIYDKANPEDEKRKLEYPALMDVNEMLADRIKELERNDIKQVYTKDLSIRKKLEGEPRPDANIPEKKIIDILKKRGSSMCNRSSPISVNSVTPEKEPTVTESQSSTSIYSNSSQTTMYTTTSSSSESITDTTTCTDSDCCMKRMSVSKGSMAEIEDSLRILKLVYERLQNSKKFHGPEFESIKMKFECIIEQLEMKLASGRKLTSSDLIAVRKLAFVVAELRRSFVSMTSTVPITETVSTDNDH